MESGPYLSPSVADHPLRSAKDLRLGQLLPNQLPNPTRAYLITNLIFMYYLVLLLYKVHYIQYKFLHKYNLSQIIRQILTRYSPVCHVTITLIVYIRLACVKHTPSIHSESGSNSQINFK